MPFQSEEQRRFLWARHPNIARKWTSKYGGAVQRRLSKNETYSEKKSGSRNVSKRNKPNAD